LKPIKFSRKTLKKYISKNKKLFLGIKSGAHRSEVTLFWGRFGCNKKIIFKNKKLFLRIIL